VLRVSVSSSNYPRFSVNPNNGVLLADPTYPGVNITATNTLFHSPKYPSRVILPVVNKKKQLPEVHVVKAMKAAYPSLITDESIQRQSLRLDDLIARGTRRSQQGSRTL
jgi:hypothetical protein